MKSLLLFLVLLPSAFAVEVTIGMTEAELLATKGRPASRVDGPGKSICSWSDLEVTVRSGRVASFKVRNPAAEQAAANERAQRIALQAEQDRQATAEAAQSRPPATPSVGAQTRSTVQEKRDKAWRARRIMYLKDCIARNHRIIESADREFSNPGHGSSRSFSSTNARVDAARAEIEASEAEIAEIEQQRTD